ncbi:MAG: OmpA family protein [Bacteroidota bacterium]
MKLLTLLATLSILLAFSCVSQQQYAELEQTLDYYKGESLATDSIRAANQQLQSENTQTQSDYQSLTRELERLTATNISLNRNYQDVVNRYNNLVGDNQEVLATTSYETQILEQELSLRQDELDRKERSLSQMETQLRDRDTELQRMEARGGFGNTPTGYGSTAADPRYQQLVGEKANLDNQRNLLLNYFQRVLVGFPDEEVSLSTSREGVVLSLNQALLFPQGGSDAVHWKGRQALQQIAVVLRDNPELPIHIIGHVNPGSNPDFDWQVSVMRSLAVAKDLANFGVDAGRLRPAGAGSNQPLVPPTNARAQIVNGRTEIEIPVGYLRLVEGLGN